MAVPAGPEEAGVCARAEGPEIRAARANETNTRREGPAIAPAVLGAQWVLKWITGASLLRHYFESSRMASSSPLRVRGYMRWPISCWLSAMCRQSNLETQLGFIKKDFNYI